MNQPPHNTRAWVAFVLLLGVGLLCAMGAYLVIQASRIIPLLYLPLGDLLRIVLYCVLLLWGILVIYGATTLPPERMARFTRLATGFEVPFARVAFTTIGLIMAIISLLLIMGVLSKP